MAYVLSPKNIKHYRANTAVYVLPHEKTAAGIAEQTRYILPLKTATDNKGQIRRHLCCPGKRMSKLMTYSVTEKQQTLQKQTWRHIALPRESSNSHCGANVKKYILPQEKRQLALHLANTATYNQPHERQQ